MSSLSSLTSIKVDALFLNRLLRKSTVARAVSFLRFALFVLMGIVGLLLMKEIVVNLYAGYQTTSRIDSEVKARLDSVALPKTSAREKVDRVAIAQQKIFGEIGAKPDASPSTPSKPVSTMALNLIGTFITPGQTPYAIIEDDKKKSQDIFNINDSIFGEAKLVKIFSDRVEINRNGQIEILKLDDSPDTTGSGRDGVSDGGNDEFVVEETELNKALENLPLLLTQARAVPYFKDGRSIGLRLFAIHSGSIFEKIGLKNGDILKSINGQSLGDLSQAMKLFEKLKEERSVNVSLERDRTEREFKYQIR